MLTRRDALKFAALAAATSAPLVTITPAEAARLLDEPMGPGPAPVSRSPWDIDVYDPVRFAEVMDGVDMPEVAGHVTPAELAAYKQLRGALLRELPILDGMPANHPWHLMDEAALGMATQAWMAGVRAGAAYENLRRALVGPTRSCSACWVIGSVDPNGKRSDAGGPEPCSMCQGNGVIAASGS
ncbi:MAG: twin-arginine translocation signal domain-containing protein [Chloroflexota bacterium]|nr:twin-arginine translocation signal domain-containing protein [Chloroflexota bacterium]